MFSSEYSVEMLVKNTLIKIVGTGTNNDRKL